MCILTQKVHNLNVSWYYECVYGQVMFVFMPSLDLRMCVLINILCYATKGKYLHMLIIFLSPFLHEGINGVTKLCQNAQSFCYSFMTWITWPKRSYYSLKFVKYISTSTLLCNICILWLGQKCSFRREKSCIIKCAIRIIDVV